MQQLLPTTTPYLLLCVALLQGCGWVDSTGDQGSSETLGKDASINGSGAVTGFQTTAEIAQDFVPVPTIEFEPVVHTLQDGQAILLVENSTTRTRLDFNVPTAQNWRWTLLDDSDGEECAALDDYDQGIAANSLLSACTKPEQCEVGFEQQTGIEETDFIISLPQLKAPVALNYTLSAELNDGQTILSHHTLCGLSVNESPTAGNDNYIAIAGKPLIVMPDAEDSLLNNDIDDVDIRNQPLKVDTQVVEAPQYADIFQLHANGGFTYRAATNTPLDADGKQTDSFVYSVSDGLHDVLAMATITIVDDNKAPLAVGSLPDVEIDITENSADPVYKIDVSPYFFDADGDSLHYTLDDNSFLSGLAIEVDAQGLLSITVIAKDTIKDSGTWPIEVTATDGLSKISTGFLLTTIYTQPVNQPPTVTDIKNRSVNGLFSYDVSVFFQDPDGDELSFSAERLPPSVYLSPSGILRGSGSAQNSGSWHIVIEATDTADHSVRDGFRLRIKR